jgi:hypothetical protein
VAEFKMRIKGTYALLTHNPLAMTNGSAGPTKGAKQIPTPDDEASAGLYLLEDGGYAFPGFGFRNSILAASAKWKKPKSRASMLGDMASLMVKEELVPLINDDGSPLRSYVIDTRRAVIQGNGILRSRPRFNEWGAEFTLEYDEALIPQDIIVNIAADAGKRIGVGDYRPQKIKGLPGPFGRYAVVSPMPSA